MAYLIKNFSWSSLLIGLAPFIWYWFNSLVTFKKSNIQELKVLAKDLIDIWSSMRESAQQIASFSSWIKQYENSQEEFYRNKIPDWYENIYKEQLNLEKSYNHSVRLMGYLYFYFDEYLIQNKLKVSQ